MSLTKTSFKFDVIGIGSPTIDFLIDKSKTVVFPGGAVSPTLVTLSRLGLKVGLIGRVGNDEYGRIIRNYLEEENVDISHLQTDKFDTAKCIIKISPHYSKLLSIENYRPISKLQKYDFAYLKRSSSVFTLAKSSLFREIANFAKENKKLLFVSLKKLHQPEDISYLVTKSKPNLIFGNEFEAKKNRELISYFKRESSTIIAITKGKRGCVVYKDSKKSYPPFKEKAIDPTGAGDVFAGAFIYGYLKSWDMDKTARFSNLMAALSTTEIGSTKRKINLKEIQNYS